MYCLDEESLEVLNTLEKMNTQIFDCNTYIFYIYTIIYIYTNKFLLNDFWDISDNFCKEKFKKFLKL